MPDLLPDRTITIEKRQALLRVQPCFRELDLPRLEQLAGLLREQTVSREAVIVADGLPVESIYFIFSGRVTVSQAGIPICSLTPGEAIGLTDIGYFSGSGKYKGTATALTNIVLLRLNLIDLQFFLQHAADAQKAMYEATLPMLKMQLIKKALPFNRFSLERLIKLSNRIEHKLLEAGTLLWKEGEDTKHSYFIQKGEIELFTTLDDGANECHEIIHAPLCLGDATSAIPVIWSTSAKALTVCDVLVFSHHHLTEIHFAKNKIADVFVDMSLNDRKPAHHSAVNVFPLLYSHGQKTVVLWQAETRRYLQLSEVSWFIWQQLNGEHTLQEITLAVADQFNLFSPDSIITLLTFLVQHGWVSIERTNTVKSIAEKQSFWQRTWAKLQRVFVKHTAIAQTDYWIGQCYQMIGRVFFMRLGKFGLAFISIVGMVAFGLRFSNAIIHLQISNALSVLCCALLLLPLLDIIGQTMTLKAYGYHVHYLGLGWRWFRPVVCVDKSDLWLSTRVPRVAANLAGMIAQLVVASLSALCLLVVTNPHMLATFAFFSLWTYCKVLFTGSPLHHAKGYQILVDLVDNPHLRHAAIAWLRQPKAPKYYWQEACFWLLSASFLLMLAMVTWLIEQWIVAQFGFSFLHSYAKLSLPVLVALLASLSILIDIRRQLG